MILSLKVVAYMYGIVGLVPRLHCKHMESGGWECGSVCVLMMNILYYEEDTVALLQSHLLSFCIISLSVRSTSS